MGNLSCATWIEAFIPRWSRSLLRHMVGLARGERRRSARPSSKRRARPISDTTGKEFRSRQNLYREVFFVLDNDFTNTLDLSQIEELGIFVTGKVWDTQDAEQFLADNDENYGGLLDFEEFGHFCENLIL